MAREILGSGVASRARVLHDAGVASFTALDDRDVAVIARGFALGDVVAVTAIAAGTISSNFAFDTRDHGVARRTFVRLNDGKPADIVAWEAALCAELAAAGVPTPSPLIALDGAHVLAHRGFAITAFAWCAGHHLAPAEVTPAHAGAIGAALAELHLAGLALPAERQRAGIYQFADLCRRFDGFRDQADPALTGAIATLADELAWLTAQAPVRAAATHGLIHGDLFRDNVLWEGPTTPRARLRADARQARRPVGPRLRAILDFEQAARGSLVYDLAVVLNDWCWVDGPAPALAAATLAGYQAVRPLTAADHAALPVEVRAAAARFTITRITDVYLRQVDNPDKDFRAFLARLDAYRGRALGALLSSV